MRQEGGDGYYDLVLRCSVFVPVFQYCANEGKGVLMRLVEGLG